MQFQQAALQQQQQQHHQQQQLLAAAQLSAMGAHYPHHTQQHHSGGGNAAADLAALLYGTTATGGHHAQHQHQMQVASNAFISAPPSAYIKAEQVVYDNSARASPGGASAGSMIEVSFKLYFDLWIQFEIIASLTGKYWWHNLVMVV